MVEALVKLVYRAYHKALICQQCPVTVEDSQDFFGASFCTKNYNLAYKTVSFDQRVGALVFALDSEEGEPSLETLLFLLLSPKITVTLPPIYTRINF